MLQVDVDFHDGTPQKPSLMAEYEMGSLIVVQPLPAPPLTKYINHVAKSFSAIFPVDLERLFYAVRISGRDGFDDFFVLGDGAVKVMNNRACVETPIAFRLRLNGLMQGHEAWSCSRLNNAAMEIVVQVEDSMGLRRARFYDFFQLAVVIPELLRDF